MNDVSNTNDLITPEELALIIKMSKSSIYRLVKERKIPFYKISGSLRFRISDIEKCIDSSRVEAIV
ncbi:MAG: helix-turn-helix domain-containing protein [Candidatus Falkowbacteria bacterium]|nr:helix-turn-helix domain-containing protein [Candidatus Falkowbacteria bacterium]